MLLILPSTHSIGIAVLNSPFWWKWPSWLVELIAGFKLQILLHTFCRDHPYWLYGLVGMAVSVGYELWFDRHGWSTKDVLQRVPGQIAGELVWALIH